MNKSPSTKVDRIGSLGPPLGVPSGLSAGGYARAEANVHSRGGEQESTGRASFGGHPTNSQGANLVQTKLAVLDGELLNSVQSNRSMKSAGH